MQYSILRPPLIASFELPTQQVLLSLKSGDHVKLIFKVGEESPERMWVKLTDCSNPDEWKGLIDSEAQQSATASELPVDKEVAFHPLDIIQITD